MEFAAVVEKKNALEKVVAVELRDCTHKQEVWHVSVGSPCRTKNVPNKSMVTASQRKEAVGSNDGQHHIHFRHYQHSKDQDFGAWLF